MVTILTYCQDTSSFFYVHNFAGFIAHLRLSLPPMSWMESSSMLVQTRGSSSLSGPISFKVWARNVRMLSWITRVCSIDPPSSASEPRLLTLTKKTSYKEPATRRRAKERKSFED